MSNELVKIPPPSPSFGIGKRPLSGLAAKKASAETAMEMQGLSTVKAPSPNDMEHRIGIVFDDSGSMMGGKLEDAHAGVEEFLRSCTKDKTAVAVYVLNANYNKDLGLCINLPAVAVMAKSIKAVGGTYIKGATSRLFDQNSLTRAIIFSDGENGDGDISTKVLKAGIPIDTVYISEHGGTERARTFLRDISAKTDGIFMEFERGKANFRTAFKYLSPGLRHMLADKSFVDKLEGK